VKNTYQDLTSEGDISDFLGAYFTQFLIESILEELRFQGAKM
jgi:hypothetical protein